MLNSVLRARASLRTEIVHVSRIDADVLWTASNVFVERELFNFCLPIKTLFYLKEITYELRRGFPAVIRLSLHPRICKRSEARILLFKFFCVKNMLQNVRTVVSRM